MFASFVLLCSVPSVAQTPSQNPNAGPNSVTEISVAGGQRTLLKIAIAPVLAEKSVANDAREVQATSNRDFSLSGLFQTLDERSFVANLGKEAGNIDPASWRNVGADAVVKGSITSKGTSKKLELALFAPSKGSDAVFRRSYDLGGSTTLRGAVHQFDNEVVKYFTNRPGSFGTRLVFSASTAKGEKGIFLVESDGIGYGRIPAVSNVAIAPSIGSGGVYYAAGLPDGSYSLFKAGTKDPVLKHQGLIFGAAFGPSAQMALIVSQNGNTDIFLGGLDGSNLRKITKGGLNTHPSFGPGGEVTYVSNESGSPQIYVNGKRVSWKGSYNMAPIWCADPEGARIVYMGRDGASWDIFSVLTSGDPASTRRLTQDQGSNTYPACSPDGRQVAFFSTRGGLFMSTQQGTNQQKIADVQGESLRWESN